MIQFPLVRFVIALAVLWALTFVAQGVIRTMGGILLGSESDSVTLTYLLALVTPLTYILGYAAYVRLVERRAVTELSLSRAPKELGLGVLLGAGFMTATVGIIWLLGGYELTRTYA